MWLIGASHFLSYEVHEMGGVDLSRCNDLMRRCGRVKSYWDRDGLHPSLVAEGYFLLPHATLPSGGLKDRATGHASCSFRTEG